MMYEIGLNLHLNIFLNFLVGFHKVYWLGENLQVLITTSKPITHRPKERKAFFL